MHVPKIVEIKEIIKESESVKTFIFDWDVGGVTPGQFMMVWNFEDEKPMSLSHIHPEKDEIGISIKKVGDFTQKIHQLEEGDQLGLRGSYGRGFEIVGSRVLAVGGGIGMAPIAAFAEEAVQRKIEVDLVIAASSKDELLFLDRLDITGINLKLCTDDGSYGFCGFGSDLAIKLLKNEDYQMMVSCGPEVLMKKLWDMAYKFKIPAQFSLERYMKCGIGLCGQCCVDDVGWRVCVEGPVFWSDELSLITEFGKYRRDASGWKQSIH